MDRWQEIESIDDLSLVRWQRVPALLSVPPYAAFWEAWAFPGDTASAPVLRRAAKQFWRTRLVVYEQLRKSNDDRTASCKSAIEAFKTMFQQLHDHSAVKACEVF